MNNPLPASCCLVPARALPAACRTAFAGAVSFLSADRWRHLAGTHRAADLISTIFQQCTATTPMPAPAGHSLPLLRQKTVDRRLLCLLPQQQHCAMPDPTIEPDAARVGHAVAACTFAAPGAANYCRFAHAVRFWGIAGALQLCPCSRSLWPPDWKLELVAHR